MNQLLVVLFASLVLAPAATTQGEDRPHPWPVRVAGTAKWPTLAAAAGFTTMAVLRSRDADQVFSGLQRVCRANVDACRLTPDGIYPVEDTERLYRETLRLDAQARRWMIAGQISLFISGGLFLLDLITAEDPPDIPFVPLEAWVQGDKVGLRFRF